MFLLMGCFVDGSQEAENIANVVKIDKNVMALCIGYYLVGPYKGTIAGTPYYVRYMTIVGF